MFAPIAVNPKPLLRMKLRLLDHAPDAFGRDDEVVVQDDLGLGDGRATVYTCDLTHGYITINGDYRS